MQSLAIDLASGTGSTTLVATGAAQRFRVEHVTVVPGASGAFELLSGSSTLTGEINALAGVSYTFFDLRAVDVGDDLVLSRIDAMEVGGKLDYRVTGAA